MSDYQRLIFRKNFRRLYDQKWKSQKKTQADFAEAVCAEIWKADPKADPKVTDRYVSNWYNGKSFPEDHLKYIARVLGVEEAELMVASYEDLIQHSDKKAQEDVEKIRQAGRSFGLDDNFYKYMIDSHPDIMGHASIESRLAVIMQDGHTVPPMSQRPQVDPYYQYKQDDGSVVNVDTGTLEMMARIQKKVDEYVRQLLMMEARDQDLHNLEVMVNDIAEASGEDLRIFNGKIYHKTDDGSGVTSEKRISSSEKISACDQALKFLSHDGGTLSLGYIVGVFENVLNVKYEKGGFTDGTDKEEK